MRLNDHYPSMNIHGPKKLMQPTQKAAWLISRCHIKACLQELFSLTGIMNDNPILTRSTKRANTFFQVPSREPFAFAGLWSTWQKDYHGFTIITRDAVGEIRRYLQTLFYPYGLVRFHPKKHPYLYKTMDTFKITYYT